MTTKQPNMKCLGGDPIAAHAAAWAKFEATPHNKAGDMPAAARREYHAAQDRLIRCHAGSPSGIAYKLALALHMSGPSRPFPMHSAELAELIKGGAAVDDALVASATLDCLTLAASARDAERLVQADADVRSAWDAVVAAYEAAQAEHERVSAEFDAAYEAVRREHPVPASLRIDDVRQYTSEKMIEETTHLSIEQRMAMLTDYRAWHPDLVAAFEAIGLRDGSDPSDLTSDAAWQAFERVLETTPPDVTALAYQMRLFIGRCHVELQGETADDPSAVSRMLSSGINESRGVMSLYRNVLRLAGQHTPALDAEPFDAGEWLIAFERLPGHTMTKRGPAYQEPDAWGMECPTEDDFLITDPDAISSYVAHIQAKFESAAWEAESRRWGYDQLRPFRLPQREAIAWAYPDNPEERERLYGLWDRRAGHMKGSPVGAPLWRGLADWQKDAIKYFISARERCDAAGWIDRWREEGGTVHVAFDDDGRIVIGRPVPIPEIFGELESEIREDGALKSAVLAHLRQGF